jgi:hypothetical protein
MHKINRDIKSSERLREVTAYCLHCKVKQPVSQAAYTLTRYGYFAMTGICRCCGTRIWRLCSCDEYELHLRESSP